MGCVSQLTRQAFTFFLLTLSKIALTRGEFGDILQYTGNHYCILVLYDDMTPQTFENTTETVANVIACSSRLFRHYGYKKTSVADIVADVHISKKTLYLIFPSKREILSECAWRDTVDSIKAFGSTVKPGSRPDVVMLALCRYIFTDRIRKGTDGAFWGLYSRDKEIREAYRASLKRVLGDIYSEGKTQGLFKPVDSPHAADTILAMLIAAHERFHMVKQPMTLFNDTLGMIADAVAFKQRPRFDSMH